MEYNELVNAIVSDVIKETAINVDGNSYQLDSVKPENVEKIKQDIHQQNTNIDGLTPGARANREAQLNRQFKGYIESAKADAEHYASQNNKESDTKSGK